MMNDAMLALSWRYVPSIYKRILKLLDERNQATAHEIAEACHCVEATAQKAIKVLVEYKCIRPASWHRMSSNGPAYPAWEIGSGKGVPKPAKLTSSEKCRRWRRKKKILSKSYSLSSIAGA